MSLLTLALTFACTSSGTVTLGDGTGTNDTGTNDTGEVEPDPNPAAGEYEGELVWAMPEWDWTICEMKVELEIDEEGVFEMDETCIYYGQQGGKYDLSIHIEGVVDEDGKLEGEIEFQSWAIEDREYFLDDFSSELEGEVDGDEINLEFGDVADMDRYGEVEIFGYISIAR